MTARKRPVQKAVVKLTQRALEDLLAIESYSVQEWGRKTAEKYLSGIAGALDRLRENPAILQLEPDISPGLYFYRVKKHYLVCDFQGTDVIVLTVIHTSMDLPTRLLELEPRLLAESQILRARLHSNPDAR